MQKILFVNPEKCTGCRICETTCSLHNDKVCNPVRARIHVMKWENAGVYIPMICQQCETPICETVCPMNAIQKEDNTGALLIDYNLCVGCKLCVMFCPFGGVGIDKLGKIIKCNLCDGDPICVKNCEPEALQYIEANTINLRKKRVAAEKYSELMKKLLAVTS
ncbi:MAG: 4Fe-4S dicluster domain-containing protein [Candidatus Hodarchaeales archaeon]|jgi:Fe-S-cluster-containing hydrogenase component 2